MIRILLYLIVVFAIAAGFAWLADRPGELLVTWQGYEIRLSLMVAAIVVALVLAGLALIGWVLRTVLSTPHLLGRFLGVRRRERGYRALSTGMIAVGAGDVRTARRAADESRALLGEEPLTLLLAAQAAQLAGDSAAARQAFEALSDGTDTKLLGLHGLFVEAQRQGEHVAARHFAEEAMHIAPRLAWAGPALFEYQSRAGDWHGALRTLSANADAKLVDKAEAKRLRAVLLTARAMALETGDPDEARVLAQEAHRLAPDLVPAALIAARLLTRRGDVRRASKVLEVTWKAAPHPDIAEAYAHVRSGDSARDRLKRVRRLNALRANHAEGAMALARAAIDARDWSAARAALAGLVAAGPSERVCLLMAEIEEAEHGDSGRLRQWLTRAVAAPRDPAWIADGHVFPAWAPVSPVSGRIDAFEWAAISEHLPAPRERPPAEPETAAIPAPAPALPPVRSEAEQPGRALPVTPPRPVDAPPAEITLTPVSPPVAVVTAEAAAPVKAEPPQSAAVPPPEAQKPAPALPEQPVTRLAPEAAGEEVKPPIPDDPGPEPLDDDQRRRFPGF